MDDLGTEQRPSDDELDRMYRRLLDELNIPESKRGSMLSQPMHMKWKLLSKHQRYVRVQSSSYGSYGGAVRCVNTLDRMLLEIDNVSEADIMDIRIDMKRDGEWVQAFLELGGLHKLVNLLNIALERQEIRMQVDLLESLYILMQGNENTVKVLLSDVDALAIIVLCMPSPCAETQKLSLAVLDVLHFVATSSSSGHARVLAAFEEYRIEKQEEMRFVTLIQHARTEELDMGVKTRAFRLVNAILIGAAKVEERIALRTDFCHLGIIRLLEDLDGLLDLFNEENERREDLADILECIQTFRDSATEDNGRILDQAPTTGSWVADLDVLFAKIKHSAITSGASRELMATLHALLVIPDAPVLARQIWGLLGETCQQIVANPDAKFMTFRDVENCYLSKDKRFEALQERGKKVAQLERELSDARADLVELEKAHAEQMKSLKVAHEKELRQAEEKAATASIAAKNNASESDTKSSGSMQVDAKYQKYADMLSKGLPEGAVRCAFLRDGLTEEDQKAFFDQLQSQPSGETSKAQGKKESTSLDPKLEKYHKMIQHGLPMGAVQNAMIRDGLTENDQNQFIQFVTAIQERGHEQEEEEEEEKKEDDVGDSKDGTTNEQLEKIKQDPKFQKYVKMQHAGLPEGAVENAMVRDGIEEVDRNLFFGRKASNSAVVAGAKKTAKAVELPPPPPKVKPKQKVEPRTPMKALFWSKLPDEKVDGTLWLELDDSKVDISLDALEERFAQHAQKPPSNNAPTGRVGVAKGRDNNTENSGDESHAKKNQAVELIEPNRQRNVGITFARLRMSPQMLKACIQELDLKRLGGPDRVSMLSNLVPTMEEVAIVKQYDGDKSKLGKIEQLFIELSTVNHLEQRIRAWQIQIRLKQQVAETREQVELVLKACEEVSGSSALKQVLRALLALGNYLNGSTGRGGAYGFKLDLLTKVQSIKSADNKTNLLQFLVRELAEKKYQGMLRLPKDLEHVSAAAHTSLLGICQSCKALENDMAFVSNLAKKASEGGDDETFASKLTAFTNDAGKSLKHLRTAVDTAEKHYNDLLASFAMADDEDFKKDSERLFKLFDEFVQAFQRETSPPEKKERRKSFLLGNKKNLLDKGAKQGAAATTAPPKAPSILDGIRNHKGLRRTHGVQLGSSRFERPEVN